VRDIRRYFALSCSDRWDVVRAFAWLTLVEIGLRTLGFQRLLDQARVGPTPPRAPESPRAHGRAHRCAHWIDVAARHHVVTARCLHRSLALYRWLRCEGMRSELRIGVRKQGNELKAHAWVELSGCVINDRPDAVAAFTPLGSQADQRLVHAWE
jgi:hypothetical protein